MATTTRTTAHPTEMLPSPVREARAPEIAALSERFELEARLGDDVLTTTWRARDVTLRRVVVLRLLRTELLADRTTVERFCHEARTAATLTHGNVAQLFDVEVREDVAYTVGEHVDGPSLADMLRDGPLPPRVVLALGQEAAAGLAAAHEQNVVHGALRPRNLAIGEDGRLRILEFGHLRPARPLDGRRPGGDAGGPFADRRPVLQAGGTVTKASDVGALGSTLMTALTGSSPGEDDRMADVGQSMREALTRLGGGGVARTRRDVRGTLTSVLSADPVRRPTAAMLERELQDLLGATSRPDLRILSA